METPVDALSPLLFGTLVASTTGLNPKKRASFLGTIALQVRNKIHVTQLSKYRL